MRKQPHPIPWLDVHEDFPALETAWSQGDPAPGLLAAGGVLDVATLTNAYSHGIFPWFSAGQPVLWWNPDPRMVLHAADFRLHRSLRKSISRFAAHGRCAVRFDTVFEEVIMACATKPREGQAGTWIVPEMVHAYTELHRAGYAHSVEVWQDSELVGGLYCVNLGNMVFGESMFAHRTDASKIALAALVAFCRAKGISMIDCQQNTRHLASLGAREIGRSEFVSHVVHNSVKPAPDWQFKPVYWNQILPADPVQHLT